MVEELRYRWNNYKNSGCHYEEYGTCMQQHLFEYFSEGHQIFLEHISITLIDKTNQSNPLHRENYWRSTLKTMMPWGLNVEDCMSEIAFCFIPTTGFVGIVIST